MSGSDLPSAPARRTSVAEQQASLRRVAVLVAGGADAADVFAAIAREVAQLLRPRLVQIYRWERDGTATVVGTWGDGPNPFPAGSNWRWDDPTLVAMTEHMRTGRPIRIEDVAESIAGEPVEAGMSVGVGSAAGAPVLVDGEAWGHIGVAMAKGVPLPDGVEERLADVTELVATAISNSTTREELTRLADEQAALRRVATLVARGAPPADVFDAVAEELGRLLDVASSGLVRFEGADSARLIAGWGRLGEVMQVGARLPLGGTNVISEVARTGRPARVDDFARVSGTIGEQARGMATQSAIGGPIVVAGRLWGALVAAALEGGPLPPESERRLAQFIELMSTAIANTEARVELARLADEQAALRRVATLVAQDAPAHELFAKVAEEVANVLGPAIDAAILRFDEGNMATVVAVWGEQPPGGIRVDARFPVDGSGVTAKVYRERSPVRVDAYQEASGAIADHAREHGIRSAVGCPIVVRGRLWGAMVVAHYEPEPFAADTERRVQQFTDLIATAVANAEARSHIQRLAEEQAALRRVATLVAEAAPPPEVFDAVVGEVAGLLGAAQVGMLRVEPTDEITIVAQRGQDPSVVHMGMRIPLVGDSVTTRVVRTGRSARMNLHEEGDGIVAELARRTNCWLTVGAPIIVEGRVWGVITAAWEPFDMPPDDAEARLAEFAELLDAAIANADSRDQLTASRARVLSAGDEARRRVVRDLHDGAQQRLVHTIVTLKLAQRALGEDGERAESLIADALDHAEQGNAALRELAHGILPAVLTRGGLRAAVESLAARLDLPVRVDVADERLPGEIEASAYFVAAEALTNVVKHARATTRRGDGRRGGRVVAARGARRRRRRRRPRGPRPAGARRPGRRPGRADTDREPARRRHRRRRRVAAPRLGDGEPELARPRVAPPQRLADGSQERGRGHARGVGPRHDGGLEGLDRVGELDQAQPGQHPLVGQRRGHDRRARTGGDGEQQHVEAGLRRLRDRGGETGAAAEGDDRVVQGGVGVARGDEHPRGGEPLERQPRLDGVRAARRDHGDGGLAAERRDPQAGDGRGQGHDRDVEPALADVVEEAPRRRRLEPHLDVGGHRGEPAQRARDRARQRRRRVADPQPHRRPCRGRARGATGHLGLLEDPPRLLEHRGAGLRQLDAAVGPLQEPDPELGLELADLLAHRGLRDVQALGRAAEVQLLGDGDEVAEVPELHLTGRRVVGAGRSSWPSLSRAKRAGAMGPLRSFDVGFSLLSARTRAGTIASCASRCSSSTTIPTSGCSPHACSPRSASMSWGRPGAAPTRSRRPGPRDRLRCWSTSASPTGTAARSRASSPPWNSPRACSSRRRTRTRSAATTSPAPARSASSPRRTSPTPPSARCSGASRVVMVPTLRIVIGEDDVLMREGIARLLSEAGCDVVAMAGDADDLLRKGLAHRPDVAVVDVQMPPRHADDGLLAALELRRQRPGVGVLVLSQYYEEHYALDAHRRAPGGRRLPAQGARRRRRRLRRRRRARGRRRQRARPRGRRPDARTPPRERPARRPHPRASATCSPRWPRGSPTAGSPRRWS